jgi:O-6-methylguanine DNA methyltransferase
MTATAMELLRTLRELREPGSPDLADRVLVEVGLFDQYAVEDSPLGAVAIAWSAQGITAVSPFDGDDAALTARHRARTGRGLHPADEVPAALRRRPRFDLRGLSEFERAVLEATRRIPAGEVRPYSWVAREIGRPGAVRAVGSALGRNPVPLLIPCHRVVRSDGRIGDYAFGSEAKRAVLAEEGVDPEELEQLARAGVRFVGSDTTHIYCHPTCRHARRITERHRVTLRSAAAAEHAGFRPCRVCRP